jgi:hypothetical protein
MTDDTSKPARKRANGESPSDARATSLDAGASWEPIAGLRPDPANHRKHPSSQVAKIAASIQRYGWGRPIITRMDGTIIAGHGTLLAARSLGLASVLVRRVDLTPQQARELGLLDNKLPDFSEDVQELVDQITASSDTAFRELLQDFDSGEGTELPAGEWAEDFAATPDDVHEGRFVVVCRGKIGAQPDVLQALRASLLAIDGVTVEVTWS